MVSYISSRRGYPSWWNDEDKAAADKVNDEVLPAYFQAKVDADEHLAALAHKRGKAFQAINLRPGSLTDEVATGKVLLGELLIHGQIYSGADLDLQARRQLAAVLLVKT